MSDLQEEMRTHLQSMRDSHDKIELLRSSFKQLKIKIEDIAKQISEREMELTRLERKWINYFYEDIEFGFKDIWEKANEPTR